ncbi:MAG: DUF305 domain-containing protein [Caldilineaceae bacterium]|nr:DUF305 domain-containing protein [Caldilineaceae bacterium]
MRLYSRIFIGVVLALLISGCAAAQPANEANPATGTADTSATHTGNHGDMVMDGQTSFDAMFIDSMIEHHQGAIDMAEMVLEQAEREELRTLAEAIIAAQSAEIEEMHTWREAWFPELAATGGLPMDMGDMEIRDDESVPFDQRFIEAMISHHEGAIHMAEMALEQAEREEIRTLAAAIIAAQEAEIEQMQNWLDEWFGDDTRGNVAPSPYASQLVTPVRGLTVEEVDDLMQGRGMGFARMAELNNYPGPRHLLDLQDELSLTPDQVTQIELVFQAMQTDAQALGRDIVLQEQALSDAFVAGTIDSAALTTQVRLLGEDYGQLRNIHLQAHLEVTPVLTAEQIAHYNDLRGYADHAQDEHHH